jgi:hypothetical protein
MSAPQNTLTEDQEINVNDAAEVLQWCEELGVTELELRDAVRNVGPRVNDVKHMLGEMVMERRGESGYVDMPGYPDMPAEEGAKVWEREMAPSPKPE